MIFDPTGNGTLAQKGELFLTEELIVLPAEIKKWQRFFDEIEREYQAAVTLKSLYAFSNPLFKDKEGNDRPAANEKEREIALNMTLLGDSELEKLWQKREGLYLNLQEARNRFEAARLLVQLLTRAK